MESITNERSSFDTLNHMDPKVFKEAIRELTRKAGKASAKKRLGDLTEEERAEIGRELGRKSGEARRKKAEARKKLK
jgi:general stress protein YciG